MRKYIYIFLAFLMGSIFFANLPALATILFPSGGGTGTSTAPVAGNLLIGNASGTGYIFIASSTIVSGSGVPSSRNINTTSPITGGGDLSADRTIACATCIVSSSAITWTAVQTFSTTTIPQSDIVYSTSSIGPILRASDGVCFRLSVATSGALSTTSSTCP